MYRYEYSPIGLLMCVYTAVDRSNFRHLEEAIRTASRDGTRVIVSLEDCATVDADGLAVLLRARERLNDRIQIIAQTGTQTFDLLHLAGLVDVATTGPLPEIDTETRPDLLVQEHLLLEA